MYNFLFIRLKDSINLADAQVDWLLTDADGKIKELSQHVQDLKTVINAELTYSKLILIIPDQLVSYYIADIPIQDREKRAQAAPYILEDSVISNIDQTAFIVGPQLKTNNYLVAAIDKEKLATVIDYLREHNLNPQTVITDALCLYSKDNNYRAYLNQDNNLGLIISDTITVAGLNNLNLIFEQASYENQNKLSLDIYKHKVDNINDYIKLNDTKLVINSEQNITDWLSFIVSNWFNNRKFNKINLAKDFIKQRKIDLNFNKLWKHIAVIGLLLFSNLILYKYFDNKIYSDRSVELNDLIKTTLNNINIRTTDLSTAEQLIERQNSKLGDDLQKQRRNNEFNILLAGFTANFNKSLKIANIAFADHKLEITFEIKKDNLAHLESIKENLAKQNIKLAESMKDKDNVTKTATWTMSLI